MSGFRFLPNPDFLRLPNKINYDHGRGPLTVGGPGSLNLLNPLLLRHCLCEMGFPWRSDCFTGLFPTHSSLLQPQNCSFLAVQESGALLISNLEEQSRFKDFGALGTNHQTMTTLQGIKNEKIIFKLILITLPKHKNSSKASSTLTKKQTKET